MAFKLKRSRKHTKKSQLLKRLKVLKSKKVLSQKDKDEMDNILKLLNKKTSGKIESKKLNNKKQDEVAVAIYSGDANLSDLTIGHVTSATGGYRRGRIDNRKQ